MNLLAIDSACSILSIAVSKGDDIMYTQTDAETKQSEIAMECIDSLMKKASLKPQDLNGILCMGGPGSFTGLRIGYSIAKGLAISLSIPFVPVPTLDCIAYQITTDNSGEIFEIALAAIEARKNAFFYAFFRSGERLTPDTDGTAEQIIAAINSYKSEKIILAGPGAISLYSTLPPQTKNNIIIDDKICGYAKELIYTAKSKNLFNNDNSAFLYSGPEYIRKTDAELNLLQN